MKGVVMTNELTSEVKDFMLTTRDNPYNPFVQFDEWFAFDTQMGYHTCALLGRVDLNSAELSEADQDYNVEMAMSRIVDMDPLNLYRKVDRFGKFERVS